MLSKLFQGAGRETLMAEVHHFAYGWITPVMAYCLSVSGSLLGLICTSRARRLGTVRERIPWLVLAAVSIGGTGIWVMHFMAMIGFGVAGTEIRYDVAVTALSVVVAVVVVGLGLFIVGLGRPSALKILGGGLLTGLGVNAMHYIGMAAMRLDGEISYDPVRVVASIVIAVVAATVALWLSVTVNSGAVIFGSAMVMGVAVTGMHYTGMSAMSVELSEHGEVSGASSTTLIGPIVLAVVLVVMGLVYSVLAAPTEEDRAGAAFIEARMSGQAASGGSTPSGIRGTPGPGAPATRAGDGVGGGSVASRFAPRGGVGAGRGSVAGPGTAADSGVGDGSAPPGGPVPGEPAPAGLGASLRETEPYVDDQPPAAPGRWAGLTEPVHPVPRPISEAPYAGRPAAGHSGPDPAQLPRRNTRDPWTPPRTPTRHD